MISFASGISGHPETPVALGEAIGQVSEQLDGDRPSLVVVHFSPHHLSEARNVATAIHELLQPRAAFGGSVSGVIGGGLCLEGGPGISVWAATLDDTAVRTMLLESTETPEGGAVTGWPELESDAGTLILLADPFSFPLDRFLATLSTTHPKVEVAGGFASAGVAPGVNRLIADISMTSSGATGVFIESSPGIATCSIQLSRPVGESLTVTGANQGVVFELGGKPALDRLEQTFNELDSSSKRLMSSRMQLGVAIDEQKDEFGLGDFAVYDIVGADESEKSIVLAQTIDVGQTVRFHIPDPSVAREAIVSELGLLKADSAVAVLIFTPMGVELPSDWLDLTSQLDHAPGSSPRGPAIAGAYCAGQAGRLGDNSYLLPDAVSLAVFEGS